MAERKPHLRPHYIDVRSQSHGPLGGGMPSPRDLPSPRLLSGDVALELSPLDVFAAQSRLLQKQLEDEKKAGRRVSRLPPLMIANSLAENRPGYLRSTSATTAPTSPEQGQQSPGAALTTEVEVSTYRPVSIYPQVDSAPELPSEPMPLPRFDRSNEDMYRGRRPRSVAEESYFEGRREQSPANVERSPRSAVSPSFIQPRPSADSLRQTGNYQRRPQDANLVPPAYGGRALAPPRSPFAQREASPRSMSESSEDDILVNNEHLGLSPPCRQQSGGSVVSTSPTSAVIYGHSIRRTPSISSDISVGGTRLPRPAFNFSRPLSRASMISFGGGGTTADTPTRPRDGPSRQASSDSQPSFVLADETANTPVSMQSEDFPDITCETRPAPSYVYSTFSLPRGKMLQRNSLIFQEQCIAPPSPPSGPPSHPGRPSLEPGRPSFDTRSQSTDSGPRKLRFSEESMSPSSGSASTIRAGSYVDPKTMDAEEHVEKAIQFHEAGSLTKSTYHLRLAARQNHPTGMLLYALACRHGWGMRPNQKEGVAWLRKAADCASLEVAEDEELQKSGAAVDFLQKKERKAQFALSIYELGVSHMNGWGIEQDKTLALRCFEIAGSWGDADALTETAFCYAKGIGCKTDLKKAAKFYRLAESKGMSMVGNSWIYKSKYNDDEADEKKPSPKKSEERSRDNKQRSKSRSRNIFTRMKSST
ncbi:hypothetical protein BJ878DRAFT_36224 [Calycina marina]|uniref:Uncharacterized protein n=1 Tax=Calycina marina TaxID=1763456 RepID=A0A9P8CIY5_9HELO|nr:hypothetical protein BJ878DRAFT_36224 [Calycina marina]